MSAPTQKGVKSVRQQWAETMIDIGKSDPKLIVLVGDISHFLLQPFAQACPGRYYNVGICEPTIVSMGAGLAKVGFHPVIHTIAPFLIERSLEQFKLDFCYQKLGGNVVTVGSAFDYGNLGATHHCYGDAAIFKTLPGAEITYPSTPIEFDVLFRETYANGRLTLFRMPAHQHGFEFTREQVRFGKGILVAEGTDATIVATGPQLKSAMAARQTMAERGVSIEVVYIHTLRPLDVDLIRASVAKTKRVLTVEEHVRPGGLGDDVLRATADIGAAHAWVGIPSEFIRGYASYAQHCEALGLTGEGVARELERAFGFGGDRRVLTPSGPRSAVSREA